MLFKLLELIKRGGLQRPQDLASELGVSPDLLESMLLDLERMGYLVPLGMDCSIDSCARCGVGCAVAAGAGKRGWTLTDKGA